MSRNLLVVGSGRFVVRGAVDYVLPFYSGNDGGPDPALARYTATDFAHRSAMFATMRRDGVNVVRIPVGLASYRGGGYGVGGASGYLRRVVATVKAAQAAGLRVLIGWWDSLGWGAKLTSRYRSLWPMMGAVVKAVGNNPDVFYEPYNEPNGIGWSAWRSIMTATVREWRSAFDYRDVLVLDTINYSQEFSAPAANSLQALDVSLLHGPAQLVFANHRYPNGSSCFCGAQERRFVDTVGRSASTYPLLGTEYGIYSAGYPPDLPWIRELLPVLGRLETHGFNGSILFVWNWVDPNSLTTNGGQNLDAYGRAARRLVWGRSPDPSAG
ncbi:MAG: cellulase family glycosylhydrolase [Acidimicrobiales bacterium]